jgi:RNA polymerase sigma-70 factor (ECF subfamily)
METNVETHNWLAEHFEARRPHLRAVAYRMLGSLAEAEDAVQESWLRLSRADTRGVENLDGWLTTVVARVCLNLLDARKARREESLEASVEASVPTPIASRDGASDPEQEALMADAVGLALLVVLDTLNPAERLAFVLHDIFDVPFDEIAPIVDRSATATRQLASRARRRVRGAATAQEADRTRQRAVVTAFLAASREGDFDALLALLDPEVVLRADWAAVSVGAPAEVRGASAVAQQVSGRVRGLQPALVNGAVAAVAQRGSQVLIFRLTITNGKIVEIAVIADPDHLRHLAISKLSE